MSRMVRRKSSTRRVISLPGSYERNFQRARLPSYWGKQVPEADFSGKDLRRSDFRCADLRDANFKGADLSEAVMRGACLSGADLSGADMRGVDLRSAELDQGDGGLVYRPSSLNGANLTGADLRWANLTGLTGGADLRHARLIDVDLSDANISGTSVYGVAAWDVRLDRTEQRNLRITPDHSAYLSVDTLELAQFIYLLIRSEKFRDVIDTLTTKIVVILGRFTKERIKYLDIVRDLVRSHHYLPIVFDWASPVSKDLTGTVELLARVARFLIVDLSDPRSVPHELATVTPHLRTTPIQPLLDNRTPTYGMFNDLRAYPWVLPPEVYRSEQELRDTMQRVLRDIDRKIALLHSAIGHSDLNNLPPAGLNQGSK